MLTLLLLPCFLLIRKIGEWKYTKNSIFLVYKNPWYRENPRIAAKVFDQYIPCSGLVVHVILKLAIMPKIPRN